MFLESNSTCLMESHTLKFLAFNSSAGCETLWLRVLCIPVDVFGQRYALSSKLQNKTLADLLPFSNSFLIIFFLCARQKLRKQIT